MIRPFVLIIILFGASLKCIAQLDNSFFYDSTSNATGKTRNLYLNIDVNGFLKNTEYFNKIVEGRTLFGYQVIPRVTYYPNEYTTIEAGVYTWKDFGNSQFSAVEPFFRFKYEKNDIALVFGNLYGSLSHQLIEPIYEFERFINHRTEQGLQFKINKKLLYSDNWIDWRKMIYEGSDFQENILAGTNTIFKPINKSSWKVNFPFQFHIHHLGGQINAPLKLDSTKIPSELVFNAAFGNKVTYTIGNGFFQELEASNYLLGFRNSSSAAYPAFLKEGSALYCNLKIKFKRLGETYISYWNGHNYSSATGGVIFRSESTVPTFLGFQEKNRNLLIVRQIITFNISNEIRMQLRLEPYMDLNRSVVEIAYGFYIRYQPAFYLAKIPKL